MGIDELREEVDGAGTLRPAPVRRRYVKGLARRVNWRQVAQWCRDHPDQPFTLDGVHSNAVWRFRKNYPDLRVEGSNFRYVDSGRRVATLYAVFEGLPEDIPPEERDQVPELDA